MMQRCKGDTCATCKPCKQFVRNQKKRPINGSGCESLPVCNGLTKDGTVERPCSAYTDLHNEQEVRPTVRTYIFWGSVPVQFIEVDTWPHLMYLYSIGKRVRAFHPSVGLGPILLEATHYV